MKTYFYDCYDENFKPITQVFCKDTKELLEKVPNVKYLLCVDWMNGRCFKEVSANGVGAEVSAYIREWYNYNKQDETAAEE